MLPRRIAIQELKAGGHQLHLVILAPTGINGNSIVRAMVECRIC